MDVMATKKSAPSRAAVKKAPAKSTTKAPATKASGGAGAKTRPAKTTATKTTKGTVNSHTKKAPSKAAAKTAPAAKKAAPTKKAPAAKAAPAKAAPVKAAPTKAAPKAQAKAASPKAAPAKPAKPPKSPFDAKFIESQRELLLEERANYTKQAEAMMAEAISLTENREPGDVQFDEESGEGDTLAVERERDLALSAQARAAVEEIDAALGRIQAGTYGICRVSGTPIPKERLKAIPWATERVEYKVGGFGRL
jgi:RNA polymerase-binding transcription factor DksA